MEASDCKPHVCPWWVGYLLINPLRRLFEKPERWSTKFPIRVGSSKRCIGR